MLRSGSAHHVRNNSCRAAKSGGRHSIARSTPAREPASAAPTPRVEPHRKETQIPRYRLAVVDWPARSLVSLGKGVGDYSTANRDRLASRRVSPLLALEIPSPRRKAADQT